MFKINVLVKTFSSLLACALVLVNSTHLMAEELVLEPDLAQYIDKPPMIDGMYSEEEWQSGRWYDIDQNWIGDLPSKTDFSGEYTLRWDDKHLYLLARIQDDVMFDQHPDPLYAYWDDDALEVFIDEDASGGIHTDNFNAFAYHVAIDNQSVDMGPERQSGRANFMLLNDHITSVWKREQAQPNVIVWELAIKIFDDSFDERKDTNKPVILFDGKKLGFMLAYCDNDGSKERESFIGSHPIKARDGNKNLGYIDASVFDTLILIK